MKSSKLLLRLLLVPLLLLELAIELHEFWNETTTLPEIWFSLFISGLALVVALLQPRREGAVVLVFLLASLSVLLSGISYEELDTTLGLGATFLWGILLLLFPFIFLHFSLVFPIESHWLEGRPIRLIYVYVPYLAVLLITLFQPPADVNSVNLLLVLPLPVGFILGVAVFIRKYRYSLTPAEKNRLEIILAGCAGGALPYLTSVLLKEESSFLNTIADGASVLFPLGLAFAVLRTNVADISRAVRTAITITIVLGGTFVATSLLALPVSMILGIPSSDLGPWILSLLAALLLYPIFKAIQLLMAGQFPLLLRYRNLGFKPPRRFEAIWPNPYIVGNPVRTPDMFFGRKAEFRFVRETLRGQTQGVVVLLTGERRCGKTSILYQILNQRLGEEFVPIFLDMQELVVENDREFLAALAAKVLASSAGRPQEFREVEARRTPFAEFSKLLQDHLDQVEGRRLLLLIDEYELIESKIQAGKLSSEIIGYLNSLLEANPRLSFLLTGSHPFGANPVWSPLLPKAIYREISFLQRSDTEDLFQVPLKGRAAYVGGSLEGAFRLSSGHPFFSQLIGQTVVDLLNEKERPLVDNRILLEAVKRIIEHPPPQLLYMWEGFDPGQKLLLAGLAPTLRSSRDYASAGRVQKVLESVAGNQTYAFDSTRTRLLLEQLRSAQILERDQTRFRFKMDLLRLWVKEEQTVWNVLPELGVQAKEGPRTSGR